MAGASGDAGRSGCDLEYSRAGVRAGETYALDRDLEREAALGYWLATAYAAFVAE